MENRLFEVNHLASQSQIRLNDTNEVLKSLEERLRATEVILYRISGLALIQNVIPLLVLTDPPPPLFSIMGKFTHNYIPSYFCEHSIRTH